ncbi:MAG: DNA ligase D, partial [Pseudomonadota bacterium]
MPASEKNKDRLAQYRAKRSQDATPEPFGATRYAKGTRFVVQQHSARALHYDFRLEWNGVLLSWAVPKGPSPNMEDKRLAVRTEDHPLDYVNFEGVIPEGNYGAGAVIVWDRGSYGALEDIEEGLAKGKLLFQLRGYKLKGKWTLVKIKKAKKEWLLIKERDAYVDEAGTEAYPMDSVLSGRTVSDLKSGANLSKKIITQLKRKKVHPLTGQNQAFRPMLAESSEPFSGKRWVFEIKYDGYRLVCRKQGDSVLLNSRNGNDLTAVFPEISECVAALPYEHVVIDGEAVVHDDQGLPSFARLQKRGRMTKRPSIQRAAVRFPASLYAFDLLAFDDFDLRRQPLQLRKTFLQRVLPTVGPLKYSDHIEQHGEAMYAKAEEMGLEGLVAKKADSAYVSGRSSDWKKIKVDKTDDFVVVGYMPAKDGSDGFASLLLAQKDAKGWTYRGKVGSGFSQQDLRDLWPRLKKSKPGKGLRDVPKEPGQQWCKPNWVVEVRYKEVTPDGSLRHPVFLAVRDDKLPEECPLPNSDVLQEPMGLEEEVETKRVPFTNRDKVFWPDQGYTKGDLIDYYEAVAPRLLPFLENRPLVMTRYPDGIEGKNFFQKDAPSYVPDWIRIETMWSESADREVRYFIADDVESLLYIINMGTIPLHVWASRVDKLERPDWCILDLDPKDAPFEDVIKIAKHIKIVCDEISLPSFAKTSGSTGLHVLIPLGRHLTFEQCRDLGALLAQVVVSRLPKIATIIRRPASRKGKVYVDYLQNGHGRLLVSPFSARPVPSASVSMPLRWSEVKSGLTIERFNIKNAKRRL